jgi:tetratricopeptide (TPR) repeat protein
MLFLALFACVHHVTPPPPVPPTAAPPASAFDRGIAAELAGRYDEAVLAFEAGRAEGDRDAAIALGRVYTEAGRPADALVISGEVLAVDPRNATVYRNLAAAYTATGEGGLAALCAERAVALAPADADGWNDLGLVRLQSGDEPAAIAAFQKSLSLAPDQFAANMNLGLIALDSGDVGTATRCLGAAEAAAPDNADAKASLAIAEALATARSPERTRAPKPAAKADLGGLRDRLEAVRDALAACPEDVRAGLGLQLDQVQAIVDERDESMAADARLVLDDYLAPIADDCAR